MAQLKEPQIQQAEFGPWKLQSVKTHILASEGPEREKYAVFYC